MSGRRAPDVGADQDRNPASHGASRIGSTGPGRGQRRIVGGVCVGSALSLETSSVEVAMRKAQAAR